MGATAREPAPSPSVWVFLPAVAETLDLDLRAIEWWSSRQQGDFGRALGRVVAHEIAHPLAPGLPHAPRGLMAPRMNRAELLAPGTRIDSSFARALRDAVRGRPYPSTSMSVPVTRTP